MHSVCNECDVCCIVFVFCVAVAVLRFSHAHCAPFPLSLLSLSLGQAVYQRGEEETTRHGGLTKSHYAAGSLYAFTFSEYLEGLIHAALEWEAVTNKPPADGLTTEYVLNAVRKLIEDKILPNCQRGDVFDFRYALVNSSKLGEALDAVQPFVDPLFDKEADMPMKDEKGRPGTQQQHQPHHQQHTTL